MCMELRVEVNVCVVLMEVTKVVSLFYVNCSYDFNESPVQWGRSHIPKIFTKESGGSRLFSL